MAGSDQEITAVATEDAPAGVLVREGDYGAKVTTSQPRANASSASASVWSPMATSAQTRAALSPGEAASTRNPMSRLIAAWQVIRASWPAPTMPTTGGRGPC